MNGFQLDHALVLALPSLLLVAVAAAAFARRDLR
jgi:hypothetical protein